MSQKHPPTTSHNYEKKLLDYLASHDLQSVNDVDVQHDAWCDIQRGGFCNCDPNIKPWPKNKH